MPNGNLKAMIRQGIDILKIDTIIISHTHADHCFDVPFLLWYKENYRNNKKNLVTKIITDRITMKTIENLIELSYFDFVKRANKEFIDTEKIECIEIFKDLEIKREKMEHKGIEYANGFMIKGNDIKIGLTGDSTICQGIKKLANNVDVLFADMTLISGDDSHMGIDNILKLLENNRNLKIVAVHMHYVTRKKAKELKIERLSILDDNQILEL